MYRIKIMGRMLSLLDFQECVVSCVDVLYSWEDSACSMTGRRVITIDSDEDVPAVHLSSSPKAKRNRLKRKRKSSVSD